VDLRAKEDRMKEKIIGLVLLLCSILSVGLIISGQKNISLTGFTYEIIGLIGLLAVLFVYNRKYR
jgi:hypothetical protein